MSPVSDRVRGRGLWMLGFAVLLVCAGVGLGVLPWSCSREPASVTSQGGATGASVERERWSELLSKLEEEIAERQTLAQEVAELRDALASAGLLYDRGARLPDDPGETRASGGEEEVAEEAVSGGGPRPGFDAEVLVAAGLDPARAAALRERWEEYELEKLYLRDQAAREGWMMSARHRRAQRELGLRLREEIGEEDYAALLYATGRPNGVEVTDVLARSPAGDAGLEPGDQILRYDGRRVYRANELRLATSSGEPGEFVPIEVIRDGRPVTLRARRGPLGVILRGTSRAPRP